MAVSLGELATRFGLELKGDPAREIYSVATLANADSGALSFFSNPAYKEQLAETSAGCVILQDQHSDACPVDMLLCPDPYLAYARIAAFINPGRPHAPGVHAQAAVAESATVPRDVHVGAGAVIGENCQLGARSYVGPGCVLGDNVTIGDDCKLMAGSIVMHDVTIGDRSIVHPGAVIGSDGFGNAQSPEGWIKVPQLGSVRIGNDVEIGANTTIDRGAIDDTVIDNGVRLDNQIQVAHNVRIGEHTAVAAQVGIAGSTTIGRRCMIAGQSGFVGHITVCDDVVIGGATMVSKSISEPGFYTASFPAEPGRDWKRRVARIRRLDELAGRVSKLEKGKKEQ